MITYTNMIKIITTNNTKSQFLKQPFGVRKDCENSCDRKLSDENRLIYEISQVGMANLHWYTILLRSMINTNTVSGRTNSYSLEGRHEIEDVPSSFYPKNFSCKLRMMILGSYYFIQQYTYKAKCQLNFWKYHQLCGNDLLPAEFFLLIRFVDFSYIRMMP